MSAKHTPGRNRIEEIDADLAAYRNGWIQYDRDHVMRLQKERAKIKMEDKSIETKLNRS